MQPLLTLLHPKVNAGHGRLLIQIVFALVLIAQGVVVGFRATGQALIAQLRLKPAALLLQRWLQAIQDRLRGRVGIGKRGVVVPTPLLRCNTGSGLILQVAQRHTGSVLLIQQCLLFGRERQRLAVQRLTRAGDRLAGLWIDLAALLPHLTVRQRAIRRVLVDPIACGSCFCCGCVVRCLRRFAFFSHISLLKIGNRL